MNQNYWKDKTTEDIDKYISSASNPLDWADQHSLFHSDNLIPYKEMEIKWYILALLELNTREAAEIKLNYIHKAIGIITVGNIILTIINLIIKFT